MAKYDVPLNVVVQKAHGEYIFRGCLFLCNYNFMYCFIYNEFILFFDNVYIVKKGECPCGSQIRVRKFGQWGKVEETAISNLFFFLHLEKVGRCRDRASPSSPATSVAEDGGWLPGVIPGSPMWSMF